ncbi:MAG: DNA repair protein RecN [Actinomycetota bacterium]|nr:DNA repair protein RecN [Actinomycetota bacterium]
MAHQLITRLHIRGVGVIDDAQMSFSPGLTVITGETGAGKTMVLTGFSLLAGAKADPSLVRRGQPEALVEGNWLIPANSEAVISRLTEAGAPPDLEDDGAELIIVRSVPAEGRGRAVACGRTVPRSLLQEVASELLAIHGQADQWQLRSAERQREMLDLYAGAQCSETIQEYRAVFGSWRQAKNELASLTTNRAEREREAALLETGIAEIDAVAPEPAEDESLDIQSARLTNAGSLHEDITAAHDWLVGTDIEPGALHQVGLAQKSLDRAAAIDPTLGLLRTQLAQVTALLADAGTELSSALLDLEADPTRQAWVEERRAALRKLMRSYGPNLADVIQWRADADRKLSAPGGGEDRTDQIRADIARLAIEVGSAAQRLTSLRTSAAHELASQVSDELRSLSMPEAELIIEVQSTTEIEDFTSAGADSIAFLLRPHSGTDAQPVTKAASGGELSRVMLAIEVTMAGRNSVPTFIFDEVDAGIGGRTAVEVGRRLARLARQAQVIVVTHLPQVAAFADRHLVVTKSSDGLVTESSVQDVSGNQRVVELVRMLSGLEESDAGLAHAEELLAVAATERAR